MRRQPLAVPISILICSVASFGRTLASLMYLTVIAHVDLELAG
jgi:hypothetical protein